MSTTISGYACRVESVEGCGTVVEVDGNGVRIAVTADHDTNPELARAVMDEATAELVTALGGAW